MTGPSGSEGAGERRWFHPSELPADPLLPAQRAARALAPTLVRARRPWMGIALGAGLLGAVGGFGMTFLLGDDAASRSGPETSATVASTVRTLAPLLGRAQEPSLSVTQASAAVLRVTAWSGSEVRNGSGVVYRSDGLLVTSAALVGEATRVEVELADGDVVAATVTGVDPEYDLALLDVDAGGLATMSFAGGTASPRAGDSCVLVAAGDDSHDGRWAAVGVIAAAGRVIEVDGRWMIDVLELQSRHEESAAGGAVLSDDGRLLGVVATPGMTRGGDRVLAVPASRARRSVEEILTTGDVEHPWLGLAAADATEPVRGALVREIDESGPAVAAGLQPSDIVVRIGDKQVDGMIGLMREVRRHAAGETINLTFVRDGEELQVTIRLAPRP